MFRHSRFFMIMFFAAATLICVSCIKNDNDEADNELQTSLVGTVWTTQKDQIGFSYNSSLFFVSDTKVEEHVDFLNNGEVVETMLEYTYIYHSPRGTIYKSGDALEFTVDGNVLVLYEGNLQYAYARQ